MHFDPAANGPEKMDCWEGSAKLKHAQTATGYIAARGRQPTEAEQHMLRFISNQKASIEKLRLSLWPSHKGKHPSRWTGRDLGRDAEEAERLLAEGFVEFYRLRYPELCWNVHGSGLAGIANISTEAVPFLGGRAAADAANFARVVAEVVAKHMGFWDEERFRELPHQVKEARALAYVAAMGGMGPAHEQRERPGSRDFLLAYEVLRHLGVSLDRQDPKSESRVKAILERLGWTLDRSRLEDGTRPRRYVKKSPMAANEPMTDTETRPAAR